jgi:hypothetical protein
MMTETFKAYGARRGVSQQYISKLVKLGRIPLAEDGRIDPETADAALAASTNSTRRAAQRETPVQAPLQLRYIETPLSKAKAEDAEYAGKLRRLEYEREVGLLVEKTRIDKAIADGLSTILSQLRTISIRVSPKLVGSIDVRKIQDTIDEEVDRICQETADTLRAIAGAKVTKQ